ncbi:MAG: alpha/beta hydrolase [Lentisphaeria bacterium]|nr:alpha/beta hydrolase [Lentisphaeria bacterium]
MIIHNAFSHLSRAILVCAMAFAIGVHAAETRKVAANIRYRTDNDCAGNAYMQERCVLDIDYPEGASNAVVILWFHGGGLTGGGKHIPRDFYTRNSKQPTIVVGANYRLAGKHDSKGADCIRDAAAALAWVFAHIAEYGGDPAKVFVSGHSAGGYLSMMIGMDPRWLAEQGCDIGQIKGLIPMSGQALTHFRIRSEMGMNNKQPLVDDFAPIYHASQAAKIAPMLLLTGDREMEMLGRYEENALLARMMKINGHKDITLYEFQGYGHGMTTPATTPLINFVNRVSPPPVPAAPAQNAQ